jgi:hypothetical protein
MTFFRTLPKSFIFGLGILTIFTLSGVGYIPFHPDEVHLLYQSRDLELLFSHPLSMSWQPGERPVDNYRLIIPPLPKFIIGIGRTLAGFGAETVSVDWDWAKTFAGNTESGAMPSEMLLWSARFAISLLLPASLCFIFLAGRHVLGDKAGLFAMILLGTNALVLLHDRRAMSEGVLTFGVTLSILGIILGDRYPWLTALSVSTAINAKQSAWALVPAGLLAVVWVPGASLSDWRHLRRNLFQFISIFCLGFLILNPLTWRHPVGAIKAMWQSRLEWVDLQVSTLQKVHRPDRMLQTPSERIAGQVFDLFINPPSFYEVGNYVQDTAPAERQYLSIYGHDLYRGLIWGGIMLTLCLLGIVYAGLDAFRSILVRHLFVRKRPPVLVGSYKRYLPVLDPVQQRTIILLILATLLQAIFLATMVFLPAQRYVIPLVPFVCLWIAFAINRFIVIWEWNKQKKPATVVAKPSQVHRLNFQLLPQVFTQFPADSWMS